jgi:hypothetical protein
MFPLCLIFIGIIFITFMRFSILSVLWVNIDDIVCGWEQLSFIGLTHSDMFATPTVLEPL